MPPADELRDKAARMLRAAVMDAREAERALSTCSADQAALALASAESLEMLADTVSAVLPQVPEAVRSVLEVAMRASWERLQGAGLERDGVPGEPIDLARHRVVKTVAGAASGRDVVKGVLAAGITLGGRRIREAVVSATRREERDGAHRD